MWIGWRKGGYWVSVLKKCSKSAVLNPLKEGMLRILLGRLFQNCEHSYISDFMPVSKGRDGISSSGIALPLPKSIRLRVLKSSAK